MAPFAFFLVPVGALLTGMSFEHMWTRLSDGILCYATGVDSDDSNMRKSNTCCEAVFFWYLVLLFTLMSNIAMPLSTKYGSATLLWVVRAICLPLAGLLFASSAVMGKYATPGSDLDWIGLVLV